jgi:Domain of unknown function (DUF4381)
MTSASLAFSLLAALGIAPATPDPVAPPLNGAPPSTPPVEIRDIAPPIDVFPYPLWMIIAVGCVAAAVLGVIVWWGVRWIRRRPAPPPPTPRQVALRALEALRAQVREMAPYAFSIAVSDVLRAYVGAAYQLHAPRQTSPEFLAAISGYSKFSDADRSLLASFLERCDLIKFAHVDADATDSEKLLESALAFAQGGLA